MGTIGGGCTIGTPSGLSASNVQDNSFSLSWNSVSGAASYDVSIDGSVSNTTSTSVNVTGLDAGTTYSVQVRANCASGSGSYSSAISVTTTGSNCKTGANLNLVTDNYGSETSWTLTRNGSQVASGSGYANNTTYNIDLDYGAGSYVFTINDSYGDGICCSYGNGSYTITDNGGSTIASGGAFTSSEQSSWCLEGAAADTQAPSTPSNVTASNVSQTGADISWSASSDNVGVTGYDVYVDGSLDGSTSATSYSVSGLTASTSYSVSVRAKDAAGNESGAGSVSFTTQASTGGGGSETLIASTFESGLDGWLDGGSDCFRYSGSRSYEGSYSMRLRDNSGTASAMTTSSSYDVSGYSQIDIEFYFYPNSMENGEDFWVRYYDGSSWSTVAAYASGSEFNNGSFYTATVTLNSSQYNFPSNARFRFQCDASANQDQVYVDQVTITASNGSRSAGNTITSLGAPSNVDLTMSGTEIDGVQVYPSPASSFTNIAFDVDEDTEVTLNVYNMEGRVIRTAQFEATEGLFEYELDLNGFERGLYFIDLSTSYGNESAKLIVR
ncbi:MAG: fibronectin type III domain-containing protein [bacterium]|nr:fibronectin type III domain-containing protein [bacterium]